MNLGEFNHVTRSPYLSEFTVVPEKNKTLDLLYAKVKASFRANALPPLGR